jgi:hypothetical protein
LPNGLERRAPLAWLAVNVLFITIPSKARRARPGRLKARAGLIRAVVGVHG